MWEPGTLVCCVDDAVHPEWHSRPIIHELHGLKRGTVYTVRASGTCSVWGMPVVWLEEIYRDGFLGAPADMGFNVRRFRRITESRLSIFRSLLTETPKTVNVGEEA